MVPGPPPPPPSPPLPPNYFRNTDFPHPLREILTETLTCTDIVRFCMLSPAHFVCFIIFLYYCHNCNLITVEPPNNSHNSLAVVQWLHFRFLWRDSTPVENLTAQRSLRHWTKHGNRVKFYCEGIGHLSYTTSRYFLQEDLNDCWLCEVHTYDVELFKCVFWFPFPRE